MTYILTNDDGIDAPGIAALREAVIQAGIPDSVIVAPHAHQSGCSHQLTRGRPLTIDRRSDRAIAIDGTPADCTRVAASYLYPDTRFVLSGINAGGNLGADIYVSGTVAAVREAALLRIPGIAFSQYIKRPQPIDWAIATRLTIRVLKELIDHPWKEGTFWNVNLPSVAPGDPDPDIVFCQLCTQPLPLDHECDGRIFQYVGDYSLRPRTAKADVEVCFSGNIAVTQLQLW
ncbi:MAG: 5'/3'-nucleotidase SurE [Leptolyngbyaceae bacterium]|nr:5'/3'-nucleotidase SurE [Leptolyngbyaceae bacterium]